MSDNLYMANAFAAECGATKRQIQEWTRRGVIQCVPGTELQGRGRQRLYDLSEAGFAAFGACLAQAKLPIGELIQAVRVVRTEMDESVRHIPGGDPDFYRRAWQGKEESFFVITHWGDNPSYAWIRLETLPKMMDMRAVVTVVNIKQAVSPFVR
jgi:hypothetical protein